MGCDPVFAETGYRTPPTLTGNHFELTVDRLPVNFTGKRRSGIAVNGSIAGPTLRWREGDVVTVAVTNKLKTPTSIHWHGVRVAVGDGWRSGAELRGHHAGRAVRLSHSGGAERDLLVSQPQRGTGTDRG